MAHWYIIRYRKLSPVVGKVQQEKEASMYFVKNYSHAVYCSLYVNYRQLFTINSKHHTF